MSTRAPEEPGAAYPSVEDSQDVCATSFSTSPPSQCVFTLSKAQCQTATPVVTDSHRVLTMGLTFPHQLYSSRLSYQPTVLGAASSDLGYPVALAAGVSATLPYQMMVPGKEGGLPNITAQPAHGTQADHDRAVLTSPSHVTGTTSSSEEADIPSGSSTAGRSSPNKSPHILFTRKVGAFVEKPSPQVSEHSFRGCPCGYLC
ncbi:autophagy-related protein 13-like isoform X2 [Eleutherodactylus coqui]|uniref:autophagy-related protein 13-like isoform X2 n=1 Tax=Eleutherodactylus coqui TaxID=57060 RepID=UPI00346195ED